MKDKPHLIPKDIEGSLMIERSIHVCCELSFLNTFINLYVSCDIEFFRCKHLKMSKVTKATQARIYLESFMNHVVS